MQPKFSHTRVLTVTQDSDTIASGKKAGIGKTFSIVAILTVLSKFVGLLRDMVIASCYGTGIVADAYNYAYMFTGNIFILFGGLGGPFHSSTVTVLGSRKSDQTAGTMISQVFFYTFVGLAAATALVAAIAPFLVGFMAEHYDPKIADLAFGKQLFGQQLLLQLYIMLPLIILAGLVGISYGILNVFNRVFWPSLSPALASLSIIFAVLCFSSPQTRHLTGVPLAIGTLIGAVAQLLAQLPGSINTGLKFKLQFKPQPGFSEYCSMLWPAIFSTSVGQLIVYIDSAFTLGYLGEGAWTAILSSNRLVQLPLGVLLTAMLVPILPRFTEQATANKIDDLKDELRRALRLLWFLSLPLTAILLVFPTQIVQVLFQRGNFTEESTAIVSLALVYLAPSIIFYVARDLLTRVFYAFKDSKTPYYVALIAIFIKTLLDWFFVTQTDLGVGGLSTASTIITMVNLSLLTFFLKRKIGHLGFAKLVKPLSTMLIAGVHLVLNPICHTLMINVSQAVPSLAKITFLPLIVSLGAGCATGLAAYWVTCLAGGLEEPTMLSKRIAILQRFTPSNKS